MPTATAVAPTSRRSSACRPSSTPPIPITGIATAAATCRTCSSAIARIAAPDRPPLPPPSHGRPRMRFHRMRLQRVDQRDRRCPRGLRRAGDLRRRRHVGRELHDQRRVGEWPNRLEQGEGLIRALADDQPRLDVRTRHVEFDCGDLGPLADPRDEPREAIVRGRHHRYDERGRQFREPWQIVREKAVEPLVRQPDRVDEAGGSLVEARRRVAGARLGGDGLRDECREGEALVEPVAKGPARRDRVEGPAPVDDRVLEAQARDLEPGQCPDPATRAVATSSARTTGPSTQRRMNPPAARGTAQPKHAPNPHAIGASIASSAAT